MNKTDPAIMKRKELANAVLAQTKEDESNQQQALEIAILQTQKIQELEEKIQQQLANSATNSVPGRIPASIDTKQQRKWRWQYNEHSNKGRNDADICTIYSKPQARRM